MRHIAINLIILVLFLNSSCSDQKTVRLTPAITPELLENQIWNYSSDELSGWFFYKGYSFILFKKGEIKRLNLDRNIIDGVFAFKSEIASCLKQHNQLLIITKEKESLLFNLDTFNIQKTFLLPFDKESIIGFNERYVIRGKRDVLLLFDNNLNSLERLEVPQARFYQAFFKNDTCWILSSAGIIRFQKKFFLNKFKSDLQPFALYQYPLIYFANSRNELICYNLIKNRQNWKIKLDNQLAGNPLFSQGSIFVLTTSNNLFQLNGRGTLIEFYQLKSYPGGEFFLVKNFWGVPLITGGVFFKEQQKDNSFTIFKNRKIFYAYFWRDKLYFVETKSDKRVNLIALERKFDFELNFARNTIYLPGRSISFGLRSINLLKPYYQIKVFNSENKVIKEITLFDYDKKELSLILDRPGRYLIKADAFCSSGKRIAREFSFTVLSPFILYDFAKIFFWGLF